jgi:hypothetical protein
MTGYSMSSALDCIVKRYQRPPIAAESCTQSDLNLPMGIMLIILDYYSRERLEEVDEWWSGQYSTLEEWRVAKPKWPILPLLTSCKLFAKILLPTIYELVTPFSHQSFNKFLVNVPASSFKLMNTLDLSKFDEMEID